MKCLLLNDDRISNAMQRDMCTDLARLYPALDGSRQHFLFKYPNQLVRLFGQGQGQNLFTMSMIVESSEGCGGGARCVVECEPDEQHILYKWREVPLF